MSIWNPCCSSGYPIHSTWTGFHLSLLAFSCFGSCLVIKASFQWACFGILHLKHRAALWLASRSHLPLTAKPPVCLMSWLNILAHRALRSAPWTPSKTDSSCPPTGYRCPSPTDKSCVLLFSFPFDFYSLSWLDLLEDCWGLGWSTMLYSSCPHNHSSQFQPTIPKLELASGLHDQVQVSLRLQLVGCACLYSDLSPWSAPLF